VGDFHPATEEYLETIWELEESGITPMRARIVERLGVSAPAVSETVARLEREGYLTLDKDRRMNLTETGRSYARSMVRRHRLAERLLVDPGCCPHGNPIPGSANMPAPIDLVKLSEAKVGAAAVIVRIDEALETRVDGLILLEDNALFPGARVVLDAADASGVTITMAGRAVRLPDWVASYVLVDSPAAAA
jgi:DtxR family Mn-dependent transcriptional regulator